MLVSLVLDMMRQDSQMLRGVRVKNSANVWETGLESISDWYRSPRCKHAIKQQKPEMNFIYSHLSIGGEVIF